MRRPLYANMPCVRSRRIVNSHFLFLMPFDDYIICFIIRRKPGLRLKLQHYCKMYRRNCQRLVVLLFFLPYPFWFNGFRLHRIAILHWCRRLYTFCSPVWCVVPPLSYRIPHPTFVTQADFAMCKSCLFMHTVCKIRPCCNNKKGLVLSSTQAHFRRLQLRKI